MGHKAPRWGQTPPGDALARRLQSQTSPLGWGRGGGEVAAAHEDEEGVDPGTGLFLRLCGKHWPIKVLFLK